jgi:tetratricopeptide (TPR) repeat protein
MQVASNTTVLGDFNSAKFTYNNITTTFFKKGKKFFVNTDGPDGKLHDYEISHTFGVYPLQQYLIPMQNGHVQVLDIAWDSRKKSEGGQRWYHLHPHDNVKAGDVLHWSGPNLNWNYMCADCHSTNLKKNYDTKTKGYKTTYDIINVSCEACHGEGEEHQKWANSPKAYKGSLKKGLQRDFSAYNKRVWKIDPKTLKASLTTPIDRKEIDLCAKCHSRRTQVSDNFKATDHFNDHYLNVTLSENLYFSDGKIKDEVYVYNSFLQSKMYEAGVSCSDCHDVHSLKRKGAGDKVCSSCHVPSKYEAKSHTKHNKNEAGCISCHMPSRIYMGVDERNDHSFRIPRPDLSVGTDIPNACTNCHSDKKATWADQAMLKWYKKRPVGKQNFSHELQNLRSNSKELTQSLYDILLSDAPSIAKATAAGYLGHIPSKQTYTTTIQLLKSRDSELRLNALKALEGFPIKFRVRETFALLDDPAMPVRIEASRQLSFLDKGELDQTTAVKLSQAIEEYKKVLLFNADRAESQSALATLYSNLKEYQKAEEAYLEALRIQPKYVPAYVNYSNFLHKSGQDQKAYTYLQKGLKAVPDSAALYHAIGLYYTRQHQKEKALASLKQAATLEKDNPTYQYVYAVALAERDKASAIQVLEASLQRHTGDLQVLYALAYYYRALGKLAKADSYQKQVDAIMNFVIDYK